MKVIGLTGGIGSGKSTVSRFLSEMGAVIIDADKIGHAVLEPDSEAWQQVVAAFGRQILKTNREIDRKKLGKIVFGSAKALSRLNRIMHPQICGVVKAQLEQYRRQGIDVVVVEAPLLMEAGWTSLVDEVWVTLAPEATVLKRLEEGMSLSKAESQARIRSQLPAKERVKHAHVVISTDLSLDELKARVNKLWQGL
jgi:dephospho-CoA kinase